MSQLNLSKILSGDNLSILVDKINSNFDQIILNGGGPQGDRGIIGPPGLPGIQGLQGISGTSGPDGTYLFAGTGATPGTPPGITNSNGRVPRLGDLYMEVETTSISVWQLQGTTSSEGWNIVQTMQSPEGDFRILYDYGLVGSTSADNRLIALNENVANRFFIGSTAAMIGTTFSDGRSYLDGQIGVTSSDLVLPLSLGYSDTSLTIASQHNQFRLLSVDLMGATGALGGTGTPEQITTNRGGILHSLESSVAGGNKIQIYRIRNADSYGEKFFTLGLNMIANKTLLHGDMLSRVGIGVTEFDQLSASLNVSRTLSIGDSNFYSGGTYASNLGALIQGNVAIGLTNNSYAALSVNQSMVLGNSTFIKGPLTFSGNQGLIIGANVAIGLTGNTFANLAVNQSFGIGSYLFLSGVNFAGASGSIIQGNVAVGLNNNSYATIGASGSLLVANPSWMPGATFNNSTGAIIQGNVAVGLTGNSYANLAINQSLAVGNQSYISNLSFLSNRGSLIQGNIGIGITNNSYATIGASGSLALGSQSWMSTISFNSNSGAIIQGNVAVGLTNNGFATLGASGSVAIGSNTWIPNTVFNANSGLLVQGNVGIGLTGNASAALSVYETFVLGNTSFINGSLTYAGSQGMLIGANVAIGFNDNTHANLAVNQSFGVGTSSFISSLVFAGASGSIIQGNVAVGLNNNSYATIGASGSLLIGAASWMPGASFDNGSGAIIQGNVAIGLTNNGFASLAVQNYSNNQYAIALFDNSGDTVAGIYTGFTANVVSSTAYQFMNLNLSGSTANAAGNDTTAIHISSYLPSSGIFSDYNSILQVGDRFRVGINNTVKDYEAYGKPFANSGGAGVVAYDIASLVVGATSVYYNHEPDFHNSLITNGSIVIDQTLWNTGSTSNEGLFFKDATISGTDTSTYQGDWGIQYWKDSSFKVGYSPTINGIQTIFNISNVNLYSSTDGYLRDQPVYPASGCAGRHITDATNGLSNIGFTIVNINIDNGILNIQTDLNYSAFPNTGPLDNVQIFDSVGVPYAPMNSTSGLTFWKPNGTNGFFQDPKRGYLYLDDGGSVGVGTSNFAFSTAYSGVYETEVLDHGVWQANQSGVVAGDISGQRTILTVPLNYTVNDPYIVEYTIGYPGATYTGLSYTLDQTAGMHATFFDCEPTSFKLSWDDNGYDDNVIIYWRIIKNVDFIAGGIFNDRQTHGLQSTGATSVGSAKFAVDGSIICESIITTSDERLKHNIESLKSEIFNIMLLNPSSFNLNDTPDVNSVGFIAQDVLKIYPDIVRIFNDPEFEGGKMTLDYLSFIPILTRGIQEQQLMIEQKNSEIKNLNDRLSKIEKLLNI